MKNKKFSKIIFILLIFSVLIFATYKKVFQK